MSGCVEAPLGCYCANISSFLMAFSANLSGEQLFYFIMKKIHTPSWHKIQPYHITCNISLFFPLTYSSLSEHIWSWCLKTLWLYGLDSSLYLDGLKQSSYFCLMSKTSSSPAPLEVQYQEPDDLRVIVAFNNLEVFCFTKDFCLFVLDYTMPPGAIFLSNTSAIQAWCINT